MFSSFLQWGKGCGVGWDRCYTLRQLSVSIVLQYLQRFSLLLHGKSICNHHVSCHSRATQNFGSIGILDWLHETNKLFKNSPEYKKHRILVGLTPVNEEHDWSIFRNWIFITEIYLCNDAAKHHLYTYIIFTLFLYLFLYYLFACILSKGISSFYYHECNTY